MTTKEQELKTLFLAKCAEQGLKITPQRLLIFDELVKATDHPTADAIYKRARKTLSNISFDTVYRTLLFFSEIGIINQVEGTGEQKRFEPNLYKHHHFRCVKCNTIYDFKSDEYDDITVPDEVKTHGDILTKRVILEGICSNCKGK